MIIQPGKLMTKKSGGTSVPPGPYLLRVGPFEGGPLIPISSLTDFTANIGIDVDNTNTILNPYRYRNLIVGDSGTGDGGYEPDFTTNYSVTFQVDVMDIDIGFLSFAGLDGEPGAHSTAPKGGDGNSGGGGGPGADATQRRGGNGGAGNNGSASAAGTHSGPGGLGFGILTQYGYPWGSGSAGETLVQPGFLPGSPGLGGPSFGGGGPGGSNAIGAPTSRGGAGGGAGGSARGVSRVLKSSSGLCTIDISGGQGGPGAGGGSDGGMGGNGHFEWWTQNYDGSIPPPSQTGFGVGYAVIWEVFANLSTPFVPHTNFGDSWAHA